MMVFGMLESVVNIEQHVVTRAIPLTDVAGARLEGQRYGKDRVLGAGCR
jgi:hypothetical protein